MLDCKGRLVACDIPVNLRRVTEKIYRSLDGVMQAVGVPAINSVIWTAYSYGEVFSYPRSLVLVRPARLVGNADHLERHRKVSAISLVCDGNPAINAVPLRVLEVHQDVLHDIQ